VIRNLAFTIVLLLTNLIPGSVLAGKAKLTPAMCEMLGMAAEYISRFDHWSGKPRPGHVESFYPHEIKLAAAYEKLIAAYQKESGLRLTYRRKEGPHGHVHLGSDQLSTIINSFYVLKNKLATLDRKLILSSSKVCRLRYVTGAYARYGDKGRNVIRMANAGQKVETIGHVLGHHGVLQTRR
jgi:hypothetical protein